MMSSKNNFGAFVGLTVGSLILAGVAPNVAPIDWSLIFRAILFEIGLLAFCALGGLACFLLAKLDGRYWWSP
jgi:hypothetical protein